MNQNFPEQALAPVLPGQVFVSGFSHRKRTILNRFMGKVRAHHVDDGSIVPEGATLLLWGSGEAPAGLQSSVRVVRVEDGFLRSVGLGADLVAPVSWVFDYAGIYYDASAPSSLELLLELSTFSPGVLKRAGALRAKIVAAGVSKYNVGTGAWTRPNTDAKVILVPGQVESDASIARGAAHVRTNLDLVKAVRQANPDAYLVYKPHPDVLARLRHAGADENQAADYVDEVVLHAPMHQLLEQVDSVHVMTSLTGFEALLRGIEVVCHGQPFYAGWGLTTDVAPVTRRTTKRTVDELVAAALILYPTYVSRFTGLHITAEDALDEILAWKQKDASPTARFARAVRSLLRPLFARWSKK